MALIIRNRTGGDVGTRSIGISGMVFIDGLLTIVDIIEGFPGRDIGFPVDIILQQGRLETAVVLGVGDAIDIPGSFTFFGNDRFARSWDLAG